MAGEIRAMLISLLVFSALIVGFSAWYNDLNTKTTQRATNDLGNFTFIGQITNQTNATASSIRETRLTGVEIIDAPVAVLSSIVSALRLMLDSVTGTITLFSSTVVQFLHLPGWVGQYINAIFTVIIVIGLLSAILKWEI